MYYCENFNSLSVLSLYEGDLLGKVDKLYFDKKLKRLIQIELVGEDGVKFFLSTKNIYNVGKNAITVKNNMMVSMSNLNCENVGAPIGSKAYSINGEFLGVVKEVVLNEKFLTQKIVLENETVLNVDKLASCGKNTIIFQTSEQKVNVKNFMPIKTPKEFKTEEEVSIANTMPIEDKKNNVVEVNEERKQKVQSLDFLIGRICTKDIYSFNNEILIKANTSVTKKNLKEINKFAKLRELMLYLK